MSITAAAANAAWLLSNAPAHGAFQAALDDPRRAQEQILRCYIRRSSLTEFGRAHGFADVRTIDGFRRNVPVRNYDEFEPYIRRVAAGEPNILTAEPVIRLMPSSGSTSAVKLIPYTAELQREFNRAIAPWICDLFREDPNRFAGCAYWSISPPAVQCNVASSVPVGFDQDSEYLGGIRTKLVNLVMAVPDDVKLCHDMATFRYVTLRFLLARRDLRIISVWHPSFLELLLGSATENWDQLAADIATGELNPAAQLHPDVHRRLFRHLRADGERASELRRIGPARWQSIWPELSLISAWASAHATAPANALRKEFDGVSFQPKGLLATESFVTIPFHNAHPAAIRSHFVEFIDDSGRALLVDELQEGSEYAVVVTTAGGLWRYRLGDRVRMTGRVGRTPSLEFVSREDHVVDRFGEKLSEGFVTKVLSELLRDLSPLPEFAMLAPDDVQGRRYTLFIAAKERPTLNLATNLDAALQANPHYAHCRALGQLHPPKVFVISGNAYQSFARTEAAHGRRIGNIKPMALSSRSDWARDFSGAYS